MEVPGLLGFFRVLNQRRRDFPFKVDREALVQPEVFEIPVGDKVAGPAVHYLVDYHVGQAFVARL